MMMMISVVVAVVVALVLVVIFNYSIGTNVFKSISTFMSNLCLLPLLLLLQL